MLLRNAFCARGDCNKADLMQKLVPPNLVALTKALLPSTSVKEGRQQHPLWPPEQQQSMQQFAAYVSGTPEAR